MKIDFWVNWGLIKDWLDLKEKIDQSRSYIAKFNLSFNSFGRYLYIIYFIGSREVVERE